MQRVIVLCTLIASLSLLRPTSASPLVPAAVPTVLAAVTGPTPSANCYAGRTCAGGIGCIPVPTSLPAVNVGTLDPNGWRHCGGACGVKRCRFFRYCPCGQPLACEACIGG